MLFEKQDYQTECVHNICQVLEVCDVRNNDFSNLSKALKDLWQEKKYREFELKQKKNQLDVLMETGTGKTFTYLKTIFEIHKQFDKKKFIIVVPRTAIKLGVIQNIKLTRKYFFNEYKKHLKYIDYPKDGLSKIKHDFLNTDDLCILITTNSAFNSDKNKINQKTETLFDSGSVWEGIKEQNPIIIIDEPHLLKGTETQKGLDKLKDSLQIRFGATFPTEKKDKEHHLANVVYSLDSISAFNHYLVKRIAIHTVLADSEIGTLKLIDTKANSKKFKVVYDVNQVIHTKEILIGEDIGTKTGLSQYNGFYSTKITKEKVYLKDDIGNKTTLELKKGSYEISHDELRELLKQTIKRHFEKEELLFNEGIKTLSLFFIPNISDFRNTENNPNPRIKTIFEEIYKQERKDILKNTQDEEYKKYLQKDFNEEGKLQVHEGYFSGDKVSKKDKDAGFNKDDIGVNVILNEKERLLSFDTPLRFIFSVWALQEGWDNPNIFNICKLTETSKETSRRQQVGRGLRIAVNSKGNRLTYKELGEKEEEFYKINTLDMVVSGKEKEFIQAIQEEIQEASFSLVGDVLTLELLKEKNLSDIEASLLFTILLQNQIINNNGEIQSSIRKFLKNNKNKLSSLHLTDQRYNEILQIFQDTKQAVIDKNKKPKQVKIKSNKWEEFKELWETINKQSKIVYKDIEEENLIQKITEEFNKQKIKPIQIKIYKQIYNTQKDRIENKEEEVLGAVDFFKTQKLADFINFFVKGEKLPFSFVIKLLNQIDKQKIKNNPKKARERLLTILKETIHGTILSSVSYQFLDTTIYPNSLQYNDNEYKKSIEHTLLGNYFEEKKSPEHSLYDSVCYDSEIEKRIQQEDSENINKNKITVFAKLPKISIPTPYKLYNPDFAYLIEKENGKKLFLIVEAKGYKNENDIPKEEQKKIDYAKRFFKDLQKKLPAITIEYTTRFNSQDLTDFITNENTI